MSREVLRNLKTLFQTKSKYADIKLYETEQGKLMMCLNTYVQFVSGEDEQKYHNALVNSAFEMNSEAKNILILGGGDGICGRNIFRLNSTADITLVDIDKEVVDLCRTNERLRELNEGSLLKCNIEIADALEWVPQCKEKFDLVICDLPDATNDILKPLYGERFLLNVVQLLNGGGVVSIQTHLDIADSVFKIIRKLLGNSKEVSYTMPFLGDAKVILGRKISA